MAGAGSRGLTGYYSFYTVHWLAWYKRNESGGETGPIVMIFASGRPSSLRDLLVFFFATAGAAVGFPKRFGRDEQTNIVVADEGPQSGVHEEEDDSNEFLQYLRLQ